MLKPQEQKKQSPESQQQHDRETPTINNKNQTHHHTNRY